MLETDRWVFDCATAEVRIVRSPAIAGPELWIDNQTFRSDCRFTSATPCSCLRYNVWHRSSRSTKRKMKYRWQVSNICLQKFGISQPPNAQPTSSFVWASSFIHCLAALDFGACFEQPFGCLIVRPCSPLGGWWIGHWRTTWLTVCSASPCTTFTGRRGGHTPFVQAGAETSDTGAEAVKPNPGSCWEGHSGGHVPVSGIKVQSLVGLSAHSAFH